MSDQLGLFGGTFNPIHHGHLIAVQEASHQLDVEDVLYIPTGTPPHKDVPDVDPEHRLEMTRRALEAHDRFSVSTIELEMEGPSYTVETLHRLREKTPARELVFMMGSDELLQFKEWHRWEEILKEFVIVGMTRPGFDLKEIDDPVKERCTFVDIPDVQISSSLIRRRFSNDQPVRYFMPHSVWEYARKHSLYQ